MKKHSKDVGALLIDQIGVMMGPDYAVTMARERPWASITFSGTRHSIVVGGLRQDDIGVSPLFAEKLAEQEFILPGHFVADLLVAGRNARDGSIKIEILTIIDPLASSKNNV
tara:strand:+ start:4713 stop:5048 length:336 start_codon:yes stop_codon:yes gene_type:complete